MNYKISRAKVLSEIFNFALVVNEKYKYSNLDFLSLLITSLKKSSKLKEPKQVIIIWLYYCGFYPNETELFNTEYYLLSDDLQSLLNYFEAHPIYRSNNTRNIRIILERTDPNFVYIDISHTFNYPYMSGIQRVVWKLCEKLTQQTNKDNISFLKYDEKSRLIQIIPQDDISRKITARHKGKLVKYKKLKSFLGEYYSFKLAKIKWKISLQLHRILNIFFSIFNIFSFFSNKNQSNEVTIPVFENTYVLIPETVLNIDRLQTWITILKNFKIKSTMIIYDLIPIYYPEYCEVSREFVNYLLLLRHIDQVSCISNCVKDDLEKFILSVPREKPVNIDVHYLGADFDPGAEQFLPTYSISDDMILCIGTLEPRKNHRRIARAAVKLMAEGKSFQLVFAGNFGWKNDGILREIKGWQDKGYNIKIRSSISDTELKWLYSKARATIFCSLAEGFGLPIVESIFYNKMCIVSNTGSMLEIGNLIGGCLPVNPNSVDDIKSALQTILTNKPHNIDLAQKLKWPSWFEYSEKIYYFATQIKH